MTNVKSELKMVFLPSRIKEFEEQYKKSIFIVFTGIENGNSSFTDLFNLVKALSQASDEEVNEYFIEKKFSGVMTEVADGLTKTGFLQ